MPDKYHLAAYHRTELHAWYRADDHFIDPCHDDDCAREHVHILTSDEYDRLADDAASWRSELDYPNDGHFVADQPSDEAGDSEPEPPAHRPV